MSVIVNGPTIDADDAAWAAAGRATVPDATDLVSQDDLGTAAYADTGDFEAALGNPGTNGYLLSSTTLGARSWIAPPTATDRVAKSGDTMTGVLQFSGTSHAGLKLNSLTTTQRDALTPSAGMWIYNTTDAEPQYYDGAYWRGADSLAALPISIDFAALPDGLLPVIFDGATWTISSGAAINTPATLGADIITNGNMELDANWVNDGSPTTNVRSNVEAHGGTYSRKFVTDVEFEGIKEESIVVSQAKWYRFDLWSKSAQSILLSTTYGSGYTGPTIVVAAGATDWRQMRATYRESAGNWGALQIRSYLTAATTAYIDDVSKKPFALDELLNLTKQPSQSFTIRATMTIPALLQGGVALMWNSKLAPTSGVLAYHDGTNAILAKCVSGTWTNLVSAAAAYGAGKSIKVVKAGNLYTLYYGTSGSETQIGTTQTITDAVIVDNQYHGLFSTDAGVLFGSFFFTVIDMISMPTTSVSPAELSHTITGGAAWLDYNDGGFDLIVNENKTHPYTISGAKTVDYYLPSGLTALYMGATDFFGTLPSFEKYTSLQALSIAGNPFTGTLPSFASCISLDYFHAGACDFSGAMPSFAACTLLTLCDLNHAQFSGSLPSFAACTLLENFWCNDNLLTGTIPDFAPCTALELWHGSENGFTGYTAGSFATQASLASLELFDNDLPQAAVDAVLADLVTSLGLPGRVVCEVKLETNAAPSAGGAANVATLQGAGWTVTTA